MSPGVANERCLPSVYKHSILPEVSTALEIPGETHSFFLREPHPSFPSEFPSKQKEHRVDILRAQAEERMNLREKITFFYLGRSLFSQPFDHRLMILDVFMENRDIGESMVYAEAQKWCLEAGQVVDARGQGAPWILGGGFSDQNLREAGRPHQPSAPRMVRKWLTGFQSKVDSSGEMAFLSWPRGKLWVLSVGQSQDNDNNTVLSFDWKPHTDSKRPLINRGERKEHSTLLRSQTEALPLEIHRLPSSDGMFWQVQHWSVSFSLREGMPVFKDLCFVLFTSSPSLVNNCRISKMTRGKFLPNITCFLNAIWKWKRVLWICLPSLSRKRGWVFIWKRHPCPVHWGSLYKGLNAPVSKHS